MSDFATSVALRLGFHSVNLHWHALPPKRCASSHLLFQNIGLQLWVSFQRYIRLRLLFPVSYLGPSPCLECERFELLEEQVTVGEVALSESFPLCKLDFGICILPELTPDFFHELLIGRVHLVPESVPPQFSGT